MRGRGVFEIRHILGRGAVQSVERHVQRMPGTGKLQARVFQRMHIGGDGHFVVKRPAPFALVAQEVVDHALHICRNVQNAP